MKNLKLYNFLKLFSKAKALVVIKENVYELVTFNKYYNVEDYQHFLDKRSRKAYIDHLSNLTLTGGAFSNYSNCLKKLIQDSISWYIESGDFLIHRRLVVKDKYSNSFEFCDLSTELKQKISSFISLQKTILFYFLINISPGENQMQTSDLKWKGSKTELVELANALYEGGFISSEHGAISKKDFMNKISNIFGIDISTHKTLLNKAMVRENSATIIDRLKIILTDYYDKLLN